VARGRLGRGRRRVLPRVLARPPRARRRIEFPKEWRRFTATDWGSARPFWTGWFVVVQKEMQVRTVTGAPMTLLPGALVCYREWYGEDPKSSPGRTSA
jgi:hypothetical protein